MAAGLDDDGQWPKGCNKPARSICHNTNAKLATNAKRLGLLTDCSAMPKMLSTANYLQKRRGLGPSNMTDRFQAHA